MLSGYTPYPDLALCYNTPQCAYNEKPDTTADPRLPHIREKITGQIHKTALGAEALVPFIYQAELDLAGLRHQGYHIVALEQAENSIDLRTYKPPEKIALLLGEEVSGIAPDLLSQVDEVIEIPMFGQKESFNVSVATGIALYQLTGYTH